MALVDYVSDDDDDTDAISDRSSDKQTISLKRRRESDSSALPPLPSTFHNLYASSTRVSTRDDPSLHHGRTRITPHIDGNWPSHVQIEWYPSPVEYTLLNDLLAVLAREATSSGHAIKIESSLTSDLGAPLPLHISLSRAIGFSTDFKDDFLTSLQHSLTRCGVRPFQVCVSGLSWVANFERTRWFLILRLARPDNDELNRLLHACNTTVEQYGQPPLYAEPKEKAVSGSGNLRSTRQCFAAQPEKMPDCSDAFHVSIAWTLTQPDATHLSLLENVARSNTVFENIGGICFQVGEVKAKVGNKVSSIALQAKVVPQKSIFGV